MKPALNLLFCFFCFVLLLQLPACTTTKETVASRGMQNLTARYNILYNGRELLKESEQNIQLAYQDNYDVLISVYEEPNETLSQPELKKLDDVILKANAIINDKSQSKYVDDAYFLIGEANFLKSNFYNSAEFFSYIINSYPKQHELRQASLAYKARSLMNSERFTEAKSTLDTAFKYLGTEKKSVAHLYAISARLSLYANQDEEAANFLEKAVRYSKTKQNQIRWTFLLAQLQQLTGKTEAALTNYSHVIKSNAPFEMAFNATLNRLSIRDEQSGVAVNRAEQLLSLLKDDNNLEFADQVYFQIGKIYAEQGDINQAVENYNLSIRKSTLNQNQKGLSYLALADIYFKQANYIKSKAYYDSTLTSLSPQYRDYELIRKKGNSLELLADRLSIISREDTLQMLAGLSETERPQRIGILVRRQAEKALNPITNAVTNKATTTGIKRQQNNVSDKFYFNNPIALSQGLEDFKRVWGNRKLEDNWRRSERSAADITSAALNDAGFAVPVNPDEAPSNPQDLGATMAASVPTTPDSLAASNQRILKAYYDIGNYYREVLNDEAEAIKTYQTMLARFPENDLKLPLYYNLYRLYAKSNPQKSLEYKNILLNQYPGSPFARAIKSPDPRKTDEQETALHAFYNQVYDSYVQKKYPEVLEMTAQAKQTFTENKLSPQLAYLHALALGHTQNLNVLDSAFRQIVTDFPDEKLIVPLVLQHLQYIDSNRATMNNRAFALVDSDPNEQRFVEEPVSDPVNIASQNPVVAANPIQNKKSDNPVNPTEEPASRPKTPVLSENSMFTLSDSADYYFVVNVTDPSVNLSSSRFGIGQFNRANFAGIGIKHQLKSVNNQNQLIFVGVFSGNGPINDYQRNIVPVINQIMKIPATLYGTFYISKENLDKLTDRDMINKYIEFYQQNLAGSNN